MNDGTFDNHAAFNRYQSIEGMRVSNGATNQAFTLLKLN